MNYFGILITVQFLFGILLKFNVNCNENSTTSTRWPYYTDAYNFIPKPKWSPITGHVNFNSIEDFEKFKNRLSHVHNTLLNVSYNSISSLIRLYNDYKSNEEAYKGNFRKFYYNYEPIVSSDHLNCVGLTIRLKKLLVEELRHDYHNIEKHCFYAAGEMLLPKETDIFQRSSLRGNESWKHVSLAMKFHLNNRPGYFFIDQSFGVPVVTLMQDKEYPSEGCFNTSNKFNIDEYIYELTNNNFIKFTRNTQIFMSKERTTNRGGFYIGHNHNSILNITEKRAIVKSKRCIAHRYVSMRRTLDSDFIFRNKTTLEIYEEGKYFPQMRIARIFLDKCNLSDPNLGIDKETLEKISRANSIYNFQDGKFLEIIRNVSTLVQDNHFMRQLRKLDEEVNYSNQDYFAIDPQYEDAGSGSAEGEVLYDNFVNVLHNLSTAEVLDMAEHYKERLADQEKRGLSPNIE